MDIPVYPFNIVIHHLLFSNKVVAYSKVLELAAEDRDIGENAQLTFSVVAGDQEQKFYIVSHKQEQRGTLRLKKRLDYERHSEQRFNLTLKVEIQMVDGVVCMSLVNDFFFSNESSNVINPQANQWSAFIVLALALLIKNLKNHVESSRAGGKKLHVLLYREEIRQQM